MTGPEHYQTAEELITIVETFDGYGERYHALVARAQVHATLALAAATTMHSRPGIDDDGTTYVAMHEVDFEAWDAVAGESEETEATP